MKNKPNAPHGWIVVVKSNGITTCTPFDPEHSLEQLQSAVGGYIELLTFRGSLSPFDGFCNDEGKLIGLPTNEVVSALYGRDVVCGNVVLCKHDADGENIGITDLEMETLMIPALSGSGAIWEVIN